MNKHELVKNLSKHSGLSYSQVERVLEELRNIIKEEIIVGGEITVNGFFKLEYVDIKAYERRDPTTGELKMFPAKKSPRLKLSKELRKLG